MESHVFCPFVVREPEPNQPYQTGEIGKKPTNVLTNIWPETRGITGDTMSEAIMTPRLGG